MPERRDKSLKRYRVAVSKLKRAQKALGAQTEAETIERALDLVIEEDRRNRRVHEANSRFLRSGIEIRDVYGALDD